MKPASKFLHLFSWLTLVSLSSLTLLTTRAQDTLSPAFVNGDTMPDAPALAPRGTFHVGVRTLQATHADQVDVLSRMAGKADAVYDRPLTLEVWYPATLPDGQIEQTTYENTIP